MISKLFCFILLQRISGDEVDGNLEEREQWEEEQAKPMWITDNKSNIKYEITQVNYAQVYSNFVKCDCKNFSNSIFFFFSFFLLELFGMF